MNSNKLAKRYALAFFHASNQKEILELVKQDFETIITTFKQVKKLQNFFNPNEVLSTGKERVFKNIFENKISEFTISAICLLLSKHRENLLEFIIQEFILLYHNKKNLLEIHVYSTHTLNETEIKQIIHKFEKSTNKKIIPIFYIDSSLIAGIKIIYNNIQVDGSIQGGLDRLREKLAHDMLKTEILN